MVESNSPNRQISPEDFDKLKTRQETFIDTVVKDTSRGNLVLSLTWTYQWYYQNWDETDKEQHKMWKAFKLCGRVQRLDMCSFNREEFAVVPPPLFPTATSIRIGGKMAYAFFRSMVSSPEKVLSLDLDNPQGFGQFRDGFDEDSDMSDLRLNTALYPETEDENNIAVLRHPGPMSGHLAPLFGRFTRLKHLCIRTIGQGASADPRWKGADQSWSEAREKARYIEIASFIKSLSSTLVTLVFVQGIEAEETSPIPGCRPDSRPENRSGRPMDTYFLSYILPALIEGGWPQLQTVSIRGFGGQARKGMPTPETSFLARLDTAEDRLRIALGDKIELKWEKEAGHFFYLQRGSDYSDPNAVFNPSAGSRL